MYTKETFCNFVFKRNWEKTKSIIKNKSYREFCIPKKNGFRTISCLDKSSELALLQKNLVDNFLNKQPLPVCVKGFRKSESYNTFLMAHVGAKYFLRIDIKSFFPSLKKELIKRELSNIINFDSETEKNEMLETICEAVTLNGSLPQGACTSPGISNLAMARIDQRILKYCQVLGIKYTRYADDLLFSSDDFCFSDKRWFLKKVKHILSYNELELNYTKLKYGENEIVLNGYIVSENGIRLSRKRLSDIRHIVSAVDKHLEIIKSGNEKEFLQKINEVDLRYRNIDGRDFSTPFQVVQYLCGYRSFLISMLNEEYSDTNNQKELRRLIRRIENQVEQLSTVD